MLSKRRNLNKNYRVHPGVIAAILIIGTGIYALQIGAIVLAVLAIAGVFSQPDITTPVIYPNV